MISPKPGVDRISLYVGGESHLAGRDDVLKLSSNENPLGPGVAAKEAFAAAAETLERYPDGSATILRDTIAAELDKLPADRQVMLKLTLPEEAGFYAPLIAHPKVMRVVALPGGYARDEANARLARNNGMIASFSRALAEGLSAQQSAAAFTATTGSTIHPS